MGKVATTHPLVTETIPDRGKIKPRCLLVTFDNTCFRHKYGNIIFEIVFHKTIISIVSKNMSTGRVFHSFHDALFYFGKFLTSR